MHALAIFGITGRMGQALLRAMQADPTFRLCGAVASAASGRLGRDAAGEGAPTGVVVTADPRLGIRDAAVALDFSLSTSVAAHARACAEAGVPLLVGATGFDAACRSDLEQAARLIPVLIAANTSVGVSVVARLVAVAALGLGSSYDVEIVDAHHRTKRDAPSGTALALGEAVAQARGQSLTKVAAHGRSGLSAPRVPGSIGFSSLRAGDIVGEHTVIFAADGERVEITHRATDRSTFARGALRAAEWLVGQPAGLYGMRDVLGL
ncbi:MAG TPA: 4-hydroxy-tetrahydrodipicolinate reductase [Steroidobacteraceae bacterium]|jgi:4-hydroxy-tetrahydrodipicolinate reductase|nr:4-hydroxy-tetrahydrodipicolinate reductase [Steroidobacteraceae bacterium]